MFLYCGPRAAAGCCGPRSLLPWFEGEPAPVSPPKLDRAELRPGGFRRPARLLASDSGSGLAVGGIRERGVDELLVDRREGLLVVNAVSLEALQKLRGG